ncbi:MAG: citrate synthase [bacterium]|nr:citrate synthase [bacterium]
MTQSTLFTAAADKGLENVVACSSAISTIDGTTLLYRGHTIEELATSATFEEVVYLLWFGDLPTSPQLSGFRAQLQANVKLPEEARRWLSVMPSNVHPMDYLATVVATLALHDAEANQIRRSATLNQALRLTACLGTIVGAYQRIRRGQRPLAPDPERSIAWNLLRGITGEAPTSGQERTVDVCLILHADHELNASTFAARVTASTESGLYSSVLSAVGALKGRLHGGANSAVIKMLREIGAVNRVEPYLDDAFDRRAKIMGFGHRVYKDGDPRARVLRAMSERMAPEGGEANLFRISTCIEERMMDRKGLIANVDFYSATVYDGLGIPDDLFTCVFAASRVAGWCAHVLEQYENNRIYRPRAHYIGKPAVRASRPRSPSQSGPSTDWRR